MDSEMSFLMRRVIVVRYARERLWAVAQAAGRVDKALPEVLFICERNAGRSQIAAALTHHLSKGWVGVRSAGTDPDEQIDPVVVQAMSEIGVDVTFEFPKPLTDEVVRAADVVVTLGCGDACPSTRAMCTRTGRWPIRPDSRWRSCARSATSSTTTSGSCWRVLSPAATCSPRTPRIGGPE